MTTGIIAEYNPFHNGHKYQINKIKEKFNSPIICVMSGNFVQRGDMAVFNKWQRAEMAIKGGASLVLELPTVFAVSSAENFAAGAVRLLSSLGIVDNLCFGAETADQTLLTTLSQALTQPAIASEFQKNLKQGLPYALALSNAINKILRIDKNILSAPNNILGIEYLKAINQYKLPLQPYIITRKEAQHHDQTISGEIASATAIRNFLTSPTTNLASISKVIPSTSQTIIENLLQHSPAIPSVENLAQQLFYFLRTATSLTLQDIPYISEGLEHKLHKAAGTATTIEQLLSNVKSKRYPLTRLKRILIHCLLQTSKKDFHNFNTIDPQYARILAFDDTGRDLIKTSKKTATIPLISKPTKFINSNDIFQHQLSPLQKMLAIDIKATDIYNLSQNKPSGADFVTSPLYCT